MNPELQNIINTTYPQSPAPTTPVSPQVSATQLATQPQQVSLPSPMQPTAPQTFVQNLEPSINQANQNTQSLQQRIIEAQTREAEQRNNVLNQLLQFEGGNMQNTFQSAFDEGLRSITGQDPNEFMRQLADANTALATMQGRFRTQAQAVQGTPGQTRANLNASAGEIERRRAVEVGNQALLVQAMQGNYETARQIALDTANFAQEDRKIELDNLTRQYDALSGIVDQQTQQLLDQEKMKIEAEKAQIERTQNLVDSAIVAGMATVEEMQYLTSTEVPDQEKQRIAMQIINRAGVSDRQMTRAKVFGTGGGGTGTNKVSVDDIQTALANVTNPERAAAVINSIRQSANNKGRLTQTQEEQIITAQNVVGQIGNILELASNKTLPKDQAESIFGARTGVVAGRINRLQAKLGSDPDAAALNASITGLIPKVARGVFGEVGVLTDQDIARYEATVPNMFLPENANEAVSIVLLDSLAQSFGNQMEVWSKSRDVSEFETIYLDLLEESNRIKQSIGGQTTQKPQTFTANGKTYQLGADGLYYEQ